MVVPIVEKVLLIFFYFDSFYYFFLVQKKTEISETCHVSLNISHILLNNNTKLNNVLNESQSLDYECIDGYKKMTNVTCIQGYLTADPLCEPSKIEQKF